MGQVARRGTRLRGTPTWRSQRWVLVQRFAGSTNDDDTDHRWSRKIRHSPGGEAPAGQWREAARMNSCLPTEALGIGVAGADTVLGFGKYGDLTYKEVLRRDPSYCEGVVVRAADGSGMDDEFLAFAKFVVEAKEMHRTLVSGISHNVTPATVAWTWRRSTLAWTWRRYKLASTLEAPLLSSSMKIRSTVACSLRT